MDIKPFTDILSKFNIVLFVVFACSGVILFDCLGLNEKIGISDLSKNYLMYVGFAFMATAASLAFLVAEFVWRGIKWVFNNWWTNREFLNSIEGSLNNLSNKDIVILLRYFTEQTDNIWIVAPSPEVKSLCDKAFIGQSSSVGHLLGGNLAVSLYELNPVVKQQIKDHIKKRIGGEIMSNEMYNFIVRNKPTYYDDFEKYRTYFNI
ncbi:super-infection exclusion protein B [Acinetobacter proteolyticus]|uniref:super-infection exclusion protein B n=1 Tax=Acinetobacter proteolyticus TaxID=1776741 RepID=UPI003D96FC8A